MNNLADKLKTLQAHQNLDQVPSKAFPFTNDKGLEATYEEIIPRVESIKTNKIKTGLVVGTGGIFSLAKELPSIEQWLMVDRSSRMCRIFEIHKNAILQNSGVLNIDSILAETIPHLSNLEQYTLENDFENEKRSIGKYHYSNSRAQTEKLQQILEKQNLTSVCMNLTNIALMEEFSDILRTENHELAYVNFTNVHEHVIFTVPDHFYANVRLLPYSSKAVIQYSISLDWMRNLQSRYSLGASVYLRFLEQYYSSRI